jgi:hypothetical protein
MRTRLSSALWTRCGLVRLALLEGRRGCRLAGVLQRASKAREGVSCVRVGTLAKEDSRTRPSVVDTAILGVPVRKKVEISCD